MPREVVNVFDACYGKNVDEEKIPPLESLPWLDLNLLQNPEGRGGDCPPIGGHVGRSGQRRIAASWIFSVQRVRG